MIWIIEMKNGGVFEAATKRKIIDRVISHYVEKDCSAGQIKAIYCVFKNDRTDELCRKAVGKIQEIIDNGVEERRQQCDFSWECQKDLEQDYREAVL